MIHAECETQTNDNWNTFSFSDANEDDIGVRQRNMLPNKTPMIFAWKEIRNQRLISNSYSFERLSLSFGLRMSSISFDHVHR